MIEETALVVKTEDEFAWIEKPRQSACGQCSVNKGCGVSMLDRWFGQRSVQMKALNQVGAKPGEYVIVGIEEAAMIKAALMMYLLPLVLMIVFAVVGSGLLDGAGVSAEFSSILSGVAGLIVGMAVVRGYFRDEHNSRTMRISILRRTLV